MKLNIHNVGRYVPASMDVYGSYYYQMHMTASI